MLNFGEADRVVFLEKNDHETTGDGEDEKRNRREVAPNGLSPVAVTPPDNQNENEGEHNDRPLTQQRTGKHRNCGRVGNLPGLVLVTQIEQKR